MKKLTSERLKAIVNGSIEPESRDISLCLSEVQKIIDYTHMGWYTARQTVFFKKVGYTDFHILNLLRQVEPLTRPNIFQKAPQKQSSTGDILASPALEKGTSKKILTRFVDMV